MVEPHVSPLQDIREAIAARPWLAQALETCLAVPLIGIGVTALLFDQNYSTALLGIGIGVPLAAAVIERIAARQLLVYAGVFITGGLEAAAVPPHSLGHAGLAFLVGVPALLAFVVMNVSIAYRQYVPYCYGAFLGPLIGYEFVVKLCLAKMGWADLGLNGYLIAAGIGILLALEMPVSASMHARRHAHELPVGMQAPSMIPFTFTVGVLMGLGISLLLFAFYLMLLWPAGYVVAPLLVVVVIYASRPW
jgi:hypothetical protein